MMMHASPTSRGASVPSPPRSADERREAAKRQRTEYEATVRRRRELLREAEHTKRAARLEQETADWREHRKAVQMFRQARAYEAHLDACVEARRERKVQQVTLRARTAATSGIEQFESNLRQLAKDAPGYADRLQKMQTDTEYQTRLLDRRAEGQSGRQERAKRRQQVLLDQQRCYRSTYELQRQQLLLRKITQHSADERALRAELRSQAQWKKVMAENRDYRQGQYQDRQTTDEQERQAAQQEIRRREERDYARDRDEELRKVRELVEEKEGRKRAKRQQMCAAIAERIVTVALKAAELREHTDEAGPAALPEPPRVPWVQWCQEFVSQEGIPVQPVLAPAPLWREWMVQFATGTDDAEPAEQLPRAHPPPRPSTAPTSDPGAMSDIGEAPGELPEQEEPQPEPLGEEEQRRIEVLSTLCEKETLDYVSHQHLWAVPTKPPHGAATSAKLCRLVRQAQLVQHPPRAPFRRTDQSTDSFVLVVFLGKSYCGKRAAARRVARELQLCCAGLQDIVDSALAFREEHLEDAHKLLERLPPELEDVTRERIDLARRAKICELDEGLQISDETLVALVLNTFNDRRIRARAAAAARVGPDSAPPPICAPPGAPRPEDAVHGLLLHGFPYTARQFQLLEERMTTYDAATLVEPPSFLLAPTPEGPEEQGTPEEHPEEKPTPGAAPEKPQPSIVAPPSPAPAPAAPPQKAVSAAGKRKSVAPEQQAPAVPEPVRPPTPTAEPPPSITAADRALVEEPDKRGDVSGVDLVLQFDCADDMVYARYSGQRVDPASGDVYHLEYDPPPDWLLPSLEKLHRTHTEKSLLHTKLIRFRHQNKRLLAWLATGGAQVGTIDANRPLSEVCAEAVERTQAIISAAEHSAQRALQRDEVLARRDLFDAEYRERGEATHWFGTERRIVEEELAKAAAALAAPPTGKGGAAASPAAPAVAPPPAAPKEPAKDLPVPVDKELAAVTLRHFDDMTSAYCGGLQTVFVELRRLRFQCTDHFVGLSRQFRAFLSRPDSKQAIVARFQSDYNAFEGELRRDPDGLAELHLRAEQLQNDLKRETDRKKADAEEQIRSYERREWMELWKRNAAVQFRELLQLELARFQQTRSIVRFHWHARYLREGPKDEGPLIDLFPKEVEPEQPAKGKKDPKKAPAPGGKRGKDAGDLQEEPRTDEFQAAYKLALEWLDKPDAPPEEPPAKDAKAAAKRKPSTVDEQERPDPVEHAAKVVWAEEVELLRFRINAICTRYYAYVEEAQERAKTVYGRMSEWLGERIREELAAVGALLRAVRIAIEEQEPLRPELRLEGDRLTVDETLLLAPPDEVVTVPPPPPSDDADLVCLWVSKGQMVQATEDFHARAPGGLVDRPTFVRFWLRMAAAAQHKGYGIPQCWQTLERCDFESAFDSFDWQEAGVIDWRQWCTSLLLWGDGRHDSPFCICTPSMSALVDLRDALYEAANIGSTARPSTGGTQATGDSDQQPEGTAQQRPSAVQTADWPVSCNEWVDESMFLSASFWFETNGDASEVRSRQLKELLWLIFRETREEDPVPKVNWPRFLLYLCPDPQIIRGAQKGFVMLAHSSPDTSLTREQVYELFHFSPYCSPDVANDPCSLEAIASAFEHERLRREREDEAEQQPQRRGSGGTEAAEVPPTVHDPQPGRYRCGGADEAFVTEEADPESRFVAELPLGAVVQVAEVATAQSGAVMGRIEGPSPGWLTLAVGGRMLVEVVPDGEEDMTIAFGDLCESHRGRVMLNSARVFLLRRPSFG